MARQPRIHYYGAVYHVITRGNNKENIFHDPVDKEKYLSLIENYKSKYNFLLYSFVLMPNHVHMLVEVKHDPLSKIMQGIQLTYTQYFNRKYSRVGHVFQQRYQAILCAKDENLLTVIKYIHENPLRTGLTKTPDYKWSSHLYYLKEDSSPVDTEFPLRLLHRDPEIAHKNYHELMYHTPFDALGVANIYEMPKNMRVSKYNEKREAAKKVSLEDILSLVAKETKIPKELFLKKSNKPEITRARRLFLYLVVCNEVLSRTDTARYLGLSPSAVTKSVNEVESDPRFQAILKKLRENGSKANKEHIKLKDG
jgi:putative transposase